MTKNELEQALAALGLRRGDVVLLHSSLSSLGPVEGGADAVVDAFLDVLGPDGTLMAPAFGALGIIAERVANHPRALKSSHPKGAVAAIGPKAEAVTRDHWEAETAHGEATPYTRAAALGGKIVLLGVDQDRNTTLHTVEALLRLPYLSDARASRTRPDGAVEEKTWKHFPGPHRDFIRLDAMLEKAGVLKRMRIGNAEARVMDAARLIDVAREEGARDPAFVLCDNPACADCVRQRAELNRARLKAEPFTLALSARAAGRYAPEIVENAQRLGVDAVELDYLQGKALADAPADALRAVVEELASHNLAVSGLRLFRQPDRPEEPCARFRQAGITRLLIPYGGAEATLAAARAAGLRVSVYHTLETPAVLGPGLKALAAGQPLGFTFHPAHFAAIGEHPFLGAFHKGRFIKFLDQLDVVDARWDATPTPLAKGNGEIKELISILRCHAFGGYMTLGGGGRYPFSCEETFGAFMRLLSAM